jgi:hypothetical protein
MKLKNLVFIIPALVVFSCSMSRFGWKSAPEPSGKEAETSPYAEDFDPNSLNDDDINPALDNAILQSAKQSRQEPVSTAAERTQVETIINGYRIQLLATKDEDRANEMKKQAILKFDEKVHLIFETPYYKIRIGDCATDKEARELREKAIQKGFTDVMVVRTKVISRGQSDSGQ